MDTILSVAVCFFSLYGVFHLIYGLAEHYAGGGKFNAKEIYHIIPVNDSFEDIEAYIRTKSIGIRACEKYIILNKCQEDEMNKLLRLLEGEFDFLTVLNPDEYVDFMKQI